MTTIKEQDRTPINWIGTPKPEVAGDELKIWAVKNRQWFDITAMIPSAVVLSVTGPGVDNTDPARPVTRFPTQAELGLFYVKGVRTQFGDFLPVVSGITPVSLFETNFAWLGIWNAIGRVLKIRMVLTVNATSGSSFEFALNLGGIKRAAINSGSSATGVIVVEYLVTFGNSNEKKIVGTFIEGTTGARNVLESVSISMAGNSDIFIQGAFVTANVANAFAVSQIVVEVL